MLTINTKYRCKKHFYCFDECEYYYIILLTDTHVRIRSVIYGIEFDENFTIINNNTYPYFYDYFYSVKEERMLKLKKLTNAE